MTGAELTPEERAAETESYGGVPVSDQELGEVWSTDGGEQAAPSGQEPPD